MRNKFIILGLIGMLFMGCELDPDFNPNAVPTINNLSISSPTTLSCELPCSVNFTATSTLSFPANPSDQVTYTWDFGDGSDAVKGNNLVHEYTNIDNYEITLTASSTGALDKTIVKSFIVSDNGGVTAINNLSISSPDPLSCRIPNCTFVFTATSDLIFPNDASDEVSYTWDFGDGSTEESGNNITHEYKAEGDYNITLKANASGAIEVSLDQTFTVSPRNSFIATRSTPNRGYDVLEVSDGYIVFGWESIVKYDKKGLHVTTVNVGSLIEEYGFFHGYSDFQVTEEDKFLLVSTNGSYATVDKDLNFLDVNNIANPEFPEFYINALVTKFGKFYFLGDGEGNPTGFFDSEAFPATPFNPIGMPEFFTERSYYSDDEPVELHAKHKQIGDFYFMPIIGPAGSALYGANVNSFWISEFDDNGLVIHSISDTDNNNILVLGKARFDGELRLQEIDKTTGTLGLEIGICAFDEPGGLLKVDDGYVIVTIADDNDNCNPDLAIEGSNDIRILKLDFQYNTVWDRVINRSGGSDQFVREIKKANDGGFLITGHEIDRVDIDETNYLLFIKTNSEGIVE